MIELNGKLWSENLQKQFKEEIYFEQMRREWLLILSIENWRGLVDQHPWLEHFISDNVEAFETYCDKYFTLYK